MNDHAMTLPSHPDEELGRAALNNPQMLEDMIIQYHPQVYRLALSILNHPADADDAAQEAMIAAVGSLKDFRGEASLRTWLFAIAINTCRRYLRKRGTRRALMESLAMAATQAGRSPSPEDATAQREEDRQLWAAVDALDEKHRLPVILRYAHGLSVREIGHILGINDGTVHSRLFYARDRLQARLREPASKQRAGRGGGR
jgi:RNA polymerase sigma-70 factor (ECF subfamily)